jgi:hypothetical protein
MENVQQMILEQLRTLATEVQHIPQIIARLDAIAAAQTRLEQHYEDQARAIADLKARDNEFVATFTVLSGEMRQLTRDIDGLKIDISPINNFVQKINSTSIKADKLEGQVAEINKWGPWVRGLRYFVIFLIVGLLVTVVIIGILWIIRERGMLSP